MSILPGVSMVRLSGLPMPIRILAGLLGGGSVMGVAYFAFHGNRNALIIVALGLVFVFILLAIYRAILKLWKKRKASPLSQGIAGNAAAAPQGISEPARRARLDDLRRNFEQGVEKFRAAGKNLYSVPWYVLVGEPGSGKTEAIRHCNVGFPPGLQDQLQGAGGTLNMNWWFTNQAIILDTAGRLMFEEVAPGTTNEWQEFLKLLRQNRPNCPINGMLLFISVDSLIKDTADKIESKATKIAQQFDQIQRTLEVRFPVFVIIAKCDLLTGFREFFDDLNDPQLQHQIMGWSNPGNLDERFDPATVINHLETVRQRLSERRQRLLLDPVNTEDPTGRRVDQVDALYALPDSITRIGPRLRRYLEMIFVAGEWSPKPLFLRGIYFTSSMTEGSALDAELAEVLGVPVDSLPEGRVWRRDRAYFLRDLFIEKVFREKGLVTRAINVDKQQRTRRTIILTCGFLAVFLLFGLAWLSAHKLNESVGTETDFWSKASMMGTDLRIIKKVANGYAYNDDPAANAPNLAKFYGTNLHNVQTDLNSKIPYIFRPMAIFSGDIDGQRREAFRRMYEVTVLQPVYAEARVRLSDPAHAWNSTPGVNDTAALAQLMKAEYAAATGSIPKVDHPWTELDPLFRTLLSDDDYTKKFGTSETGDGAQLQNVVDWVYTDPAGGAKHWPPAAIDPGSQKARDAISAGVSAVTAYWNADKLGQNPSLSPILAVYSALRDFRNTEDKLRITRITTLTDYNDDVVRAWGESLPRLLNARNNALAAWKAATKGQPDTITLAELYTKEFDRVTTTAQKELQSLRDLTPEPPTDPSKMNGSYQTLLTERSALEAAIKQLADWKNAPATAKTLAEIKEIDASYLTMAKGTDGNQHRRFEVNAQMYELADSMLIKNTAPAAAGSTPLADAFNKIDTATATANDMFDKLKIQATSDDDRLGKAANFSKWLAGSGSRAKKFCLSRDVLAAMPAAPQSGRDSTPWTKFVEDRAGTAKNDHLLRPRVPLVTFGGESTFSKSFSPDVVGAITDDLNTILHTVADPAGLMLASSGPGAPAISDQTSAVKRNFDGYLTEYRGYWRDTVRDELSCSAAAYAEFSDALVSMNEKTVSAALDDYSTAMIYALEKVGATEDVTAVKVAAQLNQNKTFQGECGDVLTNWRALNGPVHLVRSAVLGMDPANFLGKYIVMTAKTNDGFIGTYWRSLPVAALDALQRDGQKDIQAGLAELHKYERFPLAPPGDKKEDLSLQDELNARAALEKVRGAVPAVTVAAAAAGLPAGLGAKSIGQGGLTRDKQIDAKLELLRGTNLITPEMQDYFDKMQKMLAALPADNKPLQATLTIAKDKLKGNDNAISWKYAYMLISQGTKSLKESALAGSDPDSCSVDYPDGDLAFKFRDVPNGEIRQTETFEGQWGIFRLMRSPALRSLSASPDGTKWQMEYIVTAPDKKTYSLFLTLEFKNPVPDPKDWPVPPVRRPG